MSEHKMPQRAPQGKPGLKIEDVADLTRRPGRQSIATYSPPGLKTRTRENNEDSEN